MVLSLFPPARRVPVARATTWPRPASTTGSTFAWELATDDATPADRGTDFDGVDVTGTLSVASTVTSQLVLNGTGSTVDFTTSANLSLGLKHVRTSPDHGTAYELAGTGRADPGSLLAALRLAAGPARPRRR